MKPVDVIAGDCELYVSRREARNLSEAILASLSSAGYSIKLDMLTDSEIDAAAKALREHSMSGRITVPWDKVPKSQRKKWLSAATIVLRAAMIAAGDAP